MTKQFTVYQPKKVIASKVAQPRESRHERGYDNQWAKIATAWLNSHPFCAECEHHGIIEIASVVDHVIPVRDAPELRLDRKNIWSLCTDCHNGIKRRMEKLARKLGDFSLLPKWCKSLANRPVELAGRIKDDEMRV